MAISSNLNTSILINGREAQIIDLPIDHVKYLEVEIKTPGFKLFTQVIPVRGDVSVRSLTDRFHNLHPEVENTVKRVGYLFPPIEWRYLHQNMDMVIELNKSEWVRLKIVNRPNFEGSNHGLSD